MMEAKELCDGAVFVAFREKFFPNLGKSRVYELLAIANKKKSISTTRARTRERVAKHRKNKAVTTDSVTVTESAERDAHGALTEEKLVRAASSAMEQAPSPAQGRTSTGRRDAALFGFSAMICELIRVTHNKKAKRFTKTGVPAETLARLGNLHIKPADLKRSDTAKPKVVLPANARGTPA
jgi:hypothetical protein